MPETDSLRLVPPLCDFRILVVEDDYVVAEDLRQELEALGAEVIGPVPSVSRAMAMLEGPIAPNAALLDVNLGGETVFAVAEALRARSIPFVFATGYDRWSLPRAFDEVPICEKPFNGKCLTKLFQR